MTHRLPWLLALGATLAYLPSLVGSFHFDDYNVIVHYPTVHSWSALFERAGGGVRAVLKASYTLNWTLDPGPLGFHAVNIALHALNTVLLFFIGRRLFPHRGDGPILAAALLFALHPMQTEAVTYISGRSSSLMATFYLGALLLYLRGAHWSLSALLALGIGSLRSRPWLAFGILWFFLQLAPTNSVVPRLDVANDRQLYLACWGLFLALALQVEWPRWVAVLACVAFAAASIGRQLDYRDEITLWEASVRSAPWNARAHNNLGYAYYLAGRKPEAKRAFQTALFLDPAAKKARLNLVLLRFD